MIAHHNRVQVLLGLICLVGSVLAYLAAYSFFRYVPVFVASQWGLHPAEVTMQFIAAVILAVISVSGYLQWKRRGGFFGYHQSSLYHHLDDSTAGACVVDYYAHRITGPAYMLGQIFLAGPLLGLRAISHFRNRIRNVEGLEERLVQVLGHLRQVNKWQGFDDQQDCRGEVLLLAQMGRIDFSAAKGKPRFKAFLPDGT